VPRSEHQRIEAGAAAQSVHEVLKGAPDQRRAQGRRRPELKRRATRARHRHRVELHHLLCAKSGQLLSP
jgi:hypothetical protein